MKVLFIHRSVGNNLIMNGGLYKLLSEHSSIVFSDFNQNTSTLRDASGQQVVDMKMPGDDTPPENYAELFSDEHNSALKEYALNFDKVVIKSCYPNSDIKSEEQLEGIKHSYLSVAGFFKNEDAKLMIVTSPPLRPTSTTPDNATRARGLAEWLVAYKFEGNVEVFDLYNELASVDNVLRREYRRLIWLDNHPNKKACVATAKLLANSLS